MLMAKKTHYPTFPTFFFFKGMRSNEWQNRVVASAKMNFEKSIFPGWESNPQTVVFTGKRYTSVLRWSSRSYVLITIINN